MKKVKLVLSILMVCTMLAGVMAGCGQSTNTAGSSAAPGATETTAPAATKTEADAKAGSDMSIVFIPKLTGIPWFTQMEKGLKDFANESGGMTISVSGPAEADPVQQAKVLEDVVAKKPDCIIVVPNDTKVLEPGLKKARDAGIIVITQEASTVENADADIEFLIMEQTGKQYGEALAKGMGGKGGYAIMVGGLTVESHNARADAAIAYLKENYPDMHEVTSRVEGSESVEQSHDRTLELIKAHTDLKGILYIGSNGALGGAAAIREKNLVGKFIIAGTSLPSQAKSFLKDGSISSNLIGSPYNIGKATAYIIKTLIANKLDVNSVKEIPGYDATIDNGKLIIQGKVITFHSDAEVTFDNADSFGF